MPNAAARSLPDPRVMDKPRATSATRRTSFRSRLVSTCPRHQDLPGRLGARPTTATTWHPIRSEKTAVGCPVPAASAPRDARHCQRYRRQSDRVSALARDCEGLLDHHWTRLDEGLSAAFGWLGRWRLIRQERLKQRRQWPRLTAVVNDRQLGECVGTHAPARVKVQAQ
jgi:hypothetical protein